MLGVYLATLIFGTLIIGVSLMFGGVEDADADHDHDVDHDADVDHDVDHDADADADVDHDHDLHAGAGVDHDHGHGDLSDAAHEVGQEALWLPFLSLRFWTFAAAAFGLTGTLLSLLIGSAAITFGFSLVAGLLVGTGAAWLFRQLRRETVSGDMGLGRYVGAEARVLLPIRPNDLGKICIDTLAGRVEILARTRDTRPIEPGSTVLIAHIEAGVADVTVLPDARRQIPARQPTGH